MADSFAAALADAKHELDVCRKRLADIEIEKTETNTRVLRLMTTVAALQALVNPDAAPDEGPEGFTDQIRTILRSVDHSLTPPMIKEKLDEAGYPWPNPKHALQSIHAVLQRLEGKEIHAKKMRFQGRDDVQIGYRWGKRPAPIVANAPAPHTPVR